MEILVTRHGQTEWNVKRKVQGKADIELNEQGIEQAKEVQIKLKDEKIDLIICSPLIRAKQTAQIINENKNIPIIYDERISERDFGEFEGLEREKFDFSSFWSYRKNMQYEKAENIKELFNRVYAFLSDIKERYKGKKVLIVTHGGISIPIECYFKGIPNTEDLIGQGLGNCEVKKYEIREIEIDER